MNTVLKVKLHNYLLAGLLTLLVYAIVNNFLVVIPFWKYVIIESMIIIADKFHKTVIDKLKSTTSGKPSKSK